MDTRSRKQAPIFFVFPFLVSQSWHETANGLYRGPPFPTRVAVLSRPAALARTLVAVDQIDTVTVNTWLMRTVIDI